MLIARQFKCFAFIAHRSIMRLGTVVKVARPNGSLKPRLGADDMHKRLVHLVD